MALDNKEENEEFIAKMNMINEIRSQLKDKIVNSDPKLIKALKLMISEDDAPRQNKKEEE